MTNKQSAVFFDIPNAHVLSTRLNTCAVKPANGIYTINQEGVAKVLQDSELRHRLAVWLTNHTGPSRLFYDFDVRLVPDRWTHSPGDFVAHVVNTIANAANARIIEEGLLTSKLDYAAPYIAFLFAGDRERMLVVYL